MPENASDNSRIPQTPLPARRRIYLVAGTGAERPGQTTARDLYRAAEFLKVRDRTEAAVAAAVGAGGSARWYVLSRLHGLLTPDQEVITPSKKDAQGGSKAPSTVAEWRAWAASVFAQLTEAEGRDLSDVEVILSADESYRRGLVPLIESAGGVAWRAGLLNPDALLLNWLLPRFKEVWATYGWDTFDEVSDKRNGAGAAPVRPLLTRLESEVPPWMARLAQALTMLRGQRGMQLDRPSITSPEIIAALLLAMGGAPIEDFAFSGHAEGRAWRGLVETPAVEFVFTYDDDPKDYPDDGTGASRNYRYGIPIAHGVWWGRDQSWCDRQITSPYGNGSIGQEDFTLFSRTCRGFLRLPGHVRCTRCTAFLRNILDSSGGLPGFLALQRLDVPAAIRPEDLPILRDDEVQTGDGALPPAEDPPIFYRITDGPRKPNGEPAPWSVEIRRKSKDASSAS